VTSLPTETLRRHRLGTCEWARGRVTSEGTVMAPHVREFLSGFVCVLEAPFSFLF